jgi:hypothetical protein
VDDQIIVDVLEDIGGIEVNVITISTTRAVSNVCMSDDKNWVGSVNNRNFSACSILRFISGEVCAGIRNREFVDLGYFNSVKVSFNCKGAPNKLAVFERVAMVVADCTGILVLPSVKTTIKKKLNSI